MKTINRLLKTEQKIVFIKNIKNIRDIKKGLSSHGLPKRSPTLVLPAPEAA